MLSGGGSTCNTTPPYSAAPETTISVSSRSMFALSRKCLSLSVSLRFYLLAPHNLSLGVLLDFVDNQIEGEGCQLFHTHQRHVFHTLLSAVFQQFVVDLSEDKKENEQNTFVRTHMRDKELVRDCDVPFLCTTRAS